MQYIQHVYETPPLDLLSIGYVTIAGMHINMRICAHRLVHMYMCMYRERETEEERKRERESRRERAREPLTLTFTLSHTHTHLLTHTHTRTCTHSYTRTQHLALNMDLKDILSPTLRPQWVQVLLLRSFCLSLSLSVSLSLSLSRSLALFFFLSLFSASLFFSRSPAPHLLLASACLNFRVLQYSDVVRVHILCSIVV